MLRDDEPHVKTVRLGVQPLRRQPTESVHCELQCCRVRTLDYEGATQNV
jgi:hypothetical protein